jgi:hypothetical protein
MRRAQGSTLELVGLFFDRRRADRGYAYVGASRAKYKNDVYLLGRIRRSDWLPVGGDPRGNEQASPGPLSWSDSEEDDSGSSSHSDEQSDESQEPSDDEPDDPTAWNKFRPRAWEEPCTDEETEGSEYGIQFEPREEDASTANPDVAGLFE